MSYAQGGFVPSGRLGTARLGQAIPIPTGPMPADYPNDCPMGFKRVFGVCQMDVPPAAGLFTTPFVLAQRFPRRR